MSKAEIVQKLTALFDDPNGIVASLASAEFNKPLYSEIEKLLQEYVVALQDEPDINRHIAGCVVALEGFLAGLLHHFDITQHPDKQEVGNAHARVIDLIIELMPN